MTTDLFTYVPIVRGAPVAAHEVESARSAVEVRILWGATVLHVAHLNPPRAFFVGESAEGERACDYGVPERVLGARRLPIVIADRGDCRLLFPRGAGGHIETPGRDRELLVDLKASGAALPSREWQGAYELKMVAGAVARVELAGALALQVSMVNAGRRAPVGGLATLEPGDFVYAASSLFLHLGVIALLAFVIPKMANDDDAAADRDKILAMTKLLNAAALREVPEPDDPRFGRSPSAEAGSSAASHAGAETRTLSHATSLGRLGVQGSRDAADPRLVRDGALREAARSGPIDLLLGMMPAFEPQSRPAEWGRPVADGAGDGRDRWGLFEKSIDDAVGTGGLDLSSARIGGSGTADTIGLLEMNGLGDRSGGPDHGLGSSRGPRQGTHTPTAPRVRDSIATISGHVRPEIIQRVVRQNFGRFRFCYEAGLRANPSLEGRVVVKFVIDRTGAVSFSGEAGSDLADAHVVQCVVRAFADLAFPSPEGGLVTVVYPIVFSAAEAASQ